MNVFRGSELSSTKLLTLAEVITKYVDQKMPRESGRQSLQSIRKWNDSFSACLTKVFKKLLPQCTICNTFEQLAKKIEDRMSAQYGSLKYLEAAKATMLENDDFMEDYNLKQPQNFSDFNDFMEKLKVYGNVLKIGLEKEPDLLKSANQQFTQIHKAVSEVLYFAKECQNTDEDIVNYAHEKKRFEAVFAGRTNLSIAQSVLEKQLTRARNQ